MQLSDLALIALGALLLTLGLARVSLGATDSLERVTSWRQVESRAYVQRRMRVRIDGVTRDTLLWVRPPCTVPFDPVPAVPVRYELRGAPVDSANAYAYRVLATGAWPRSVLALVRARWPRDGRAWVTYWSLSNAKGEWGCPGTRKAVGP